MLPRIRQWLIPHGKDAKDHPDAKDATKAKNGSSNGDNEANEHRKEQHNEQKDQAKLLLAANTPKPESGNYHGLVNFGNTCYCNSVIQALFFCEPFRERVLEYRKQNKKGMDSLLSALSDLFWQLQKRRSNSIKPTRFIQMLKKENDSFDNILQHDAQEFLNYLLNHIGDTLKNDSKKSAAAHSTWVQDLFQGVLTNVTRCLSCESVSEKNEHFLDLSVDIEPNSSINHCLKGFSATETLKGDHKYYCETCCSKQEANKSLEVRSFPKILALHLKRFRFDDGARSTNMTKLCYRIVFSRELRIPSSIYKNGESILYSLNAVVVHCGKEINRGHYITLVRPSRYHDTWLCFDDEDVDILTSSDLDTFFGTTDSTIGRGNTESGYILFYQKVEKSELDLFNFDIGSLDINNSSRSGSGQKSKKKKKNVD